MNVVGKSLGDVDEINIRLQGFRRKAAKALFVHVLCLLLAGIPYLLAHWQPRLKATWFYVSVALRDAQVVLVSDDDQDDRGVPELVEVKLVAVDNDEEDDFRVGGCYRYFDYQCSRYAWSKKTGRFEVLRGVGHDCAELDIFMNSSSTGLTTIARQRIRLLHGPNSIDVDVKSYARLLFQEVLNPFYVFQAFSIVLWSLDNYYYYSTCILVVSLISIAYTLRETRQQSEALSALASKHSDVAAAVVGEDGRVAEAPSRCLVPGDVIEIPREGTFMTCDAVLVEGTCVVNESVLTGESLPLAKSALNHVELGGEDEAEEGPRRRATLFSGTRVLQSGKGGARAVVLRTGFATAKGRLIRSILYPKAIGLKFHEDTIKFFCFMSVVALVGMAYAVRVYVTRGAHFGVVIRRTLDLITIVIPPALPAAMTIGTFYAQSRLKRAGVFCTSPQRINVAGMLDVVCFDKTGTLTEHCLDLLGVVRGDGEDIISEYPDTEPSTWVMATCHSLATIEGSSVKVGDPMEMQMFEATEWVLEDGGKGELAVLRSSNDPAKRAYGVVTTFPYSPSVARMTVVVKDVFTGQLSIFSKGAPEVLQRLCVPNSVPANFESQLRRLTNQGLRVIALAQREFLGDPRTLARDTAESGLSFVGLLVFQNALKAATLPVIKCLGDAALRCLVLTGDNMLTALAVADQCGIVDKKRDRVVAVELSANEEVVLNTISEDGDASTASEFSDACDTDLIDPTGGSALEGGQCKRPVRMVVTGAAWSRVRSGRPHVAEELLRSGAVFARMAPEQKRALVEDLQSLGLTVAMCGDGANDCAALKAAHVGISLSDAEASVAAPFTATKGDVSCVPALVREGRCALVTSLSVFKYMALYSMIQFSAVLMLYTFKSNFGDMQFLYSDAAVTAVSFLMVRTYALHRIGAERPPQVLLSSRVIISVLAQIAFALTVQFCAYFYLTTQPWFRANTVTEGSEKKVVCWETSTLFTVSCMQYLVVAVVFSGGPPFRLPFYKNVGFTLALLVFSATTALLCLFPDSLAPQSLELMVDGVNSRMQFRLTLLLFPILNLVIAFLAESALDMCLKRRIIS